MRVGLLGGSFNPPHSGHLDISRAALRRLGLDAVWWLVTPGNPLKDPDGYAPFEARFAAARRMAAHSRIFVSNFEARTRSVYTAETIARLKAAHPGVRFVWLMGADNLAGFHRWRNWRGIARAVPIAVFNRPGWLARANASRAAHALGAWRVRAEQARHLASMEPPAWIMVEETHSPASSTQIRTRNANWRKQLTAARN